MVFLTALRAVRCPIPDPFWKQRRIFRLTAHLYGRRRNCYRIAVRAALHQLEDTRIGRKLRKEDMSLLWNTRINAAAEEHGINKNILLETLIRCHIFLNKKVLNDLAIWEPRTFKVLTDIAKRKCIDDDDISYPGKHKTDLSYFIDRGLLRNE